MTARRGLLKPTTVSARTPRTTGSYRDKVFQRWHWRAVESEIFLLSRLAESRRTLDEAKSDEAMPEILASAKSERAADQFRLLLGTWQVRQSALTLDGPGHLLLRSWKLNRVWSVQSGMDCFAGEGKFRKKTCQSDDKRPNLNGASMSLVSS